MPEDKEQLNSEMGQQHNEQPSADNTTAAETAVPAVAAASSQDPVMELPEIPVSAAQAEPVLYAQPQPPRAKGTSGWKLFAAALALVAVGAGIGSATTFGLARGLANKQDNSLLAMQQSAGLKAVAQTNPEVAASVIPAIYKRVAPATVKIDVTARRGYLSGQGSGSGFVVDSQGYIITNYHVIDGASTISVKFLDGTVLDGKVVGADQHKDIALVKVDPGTKTLPTVVLGDSEKVDVGELAVAIGAPFGQEFTVTAGIVSAVNRTVQEENNLLPIPGAIQTDAAINPGNSGGPLLNAAGEVIGINTLIETGSTGVAGNLGIGFAVPINLAKEILPTLMAGKQVEYAFLGVSSRPLTAQIAKQLGVDAKEGAVVDAVTAGSPAEKAGIQEPTQLGRAIMADVIVAIDGKAIKDPDTLLAAIQSKKPGDVVTVTVLRGKDKVDLKATLGVRPTDSDN